MKKFWILVVMAMFGAACSTDGLSVEVSTPDAPAAAPAPAEATPTEAPAATEAPVPTATPAPTTVPEPTATLVPPPPAPTPTEIPPINPVSTMTVHVGQLDLGGVAIGTDATAAISALNAWFGSSHDTGWIEGCPFGGAQSERTLTWGGLAALFVDAADTQTFDYWTYEVDFATGAVIPGGPQLDEVLLPNGYDMTAAFDTVVRADSGGPTTDEVFGRPFYGGFDFVLWGAGGVGDRINAVGTPRIRFCD
jgi:hypothetical protein